jgi:hypothetical protein
LRSGSFFKTHKTTKHARRKVERTHIVNDIHVGSALHEQTHAVSAAILSGHNQRRRPALCLAYQCNATAPTSFIASGNNNTCKHKSVSKQVEHSDEYKKTLKFRALETGKSKIVEAKSKK